MRDPKPENIDGQKVQRHVFEHTVNWGYVALAIAVILVAWQIGLIDVGTSDKELNEGPHQTEATR